MLQKINDWCCSKIGIDVKKTYEQIRNLYTDSRLLIRSVEDYADSILYKSPGLVGVYDTVKKFHAYEIGKNYCVLKQDYAILEDSLKAIFKKRSNAERPSRGLNSESQSNTHKSLDDKLIISPMEQDYAKVNKTINGINTEARNETNNEICNKKSNITNYRIINETNNRTKNETNNILNNETKSNTTVDILNEKANKTMGKSLSFSLMSEIIKYSNTRDRVLEDIAQELGTDAKGLIQKVLETKLSGIYSNACRINFHKQYAPSAMNEEIVQLYENSDLSLKELSLYFEKRYGMHVATSTISKHARKALSIKHGKNIKNRKLARSLRKST